VTNLLPADAPALVVPELERVELGRRPVVAPGPGEVLIHTDYSGVSVGTELYAAHGKNTIWGPTPFTPGYQGIGTVVALGEGADGELSVGDSVAAFSTDGTHGAYFTAPAELTHPVERTENWEYVSMFVQPAVAANALNKAGILSGDTVLITGQGLIGQATAVLAGLRGAYVVVTDLSPERLETARRHTAHRVVDSSLGTPWEQLQGDFPAGFDVVIESTGIGPVVQDALACVRFEGKFVFEGQYPGDLSFTYDLAHQKQIDAYFPWFIGTEASQRAVKRQISNGSLDLAPLISHRTAWQDAAGVYRQLLGAERNSINGIIIDWRGAE
jgi:2-desacetyl-2-hydroxyethyl bacteriochlorophyllide A dehydrogenase